jgi:pimeloyl-ACP methyl ester carboxylesterase
MYAANDWPMHEVRVPSSTLQTPNGPIEVRPRTLFVHDTGPREDGAGTVALIAGLPPTVHGTFASIVPSLAPTYRVVGIDNFGIGSGRRDRSAETGHQNTLALSEIDFVAALGALEVERANVVGYSGGGAIAQLVARDAPQLVERLVLAATALRFTDRRLQALAAAPPWAVQALAPWLFLRRGRRFPSVVQADWHRGDPWMVTRFHRDLAGFDFGDCAASLAPAKPHVLVFTRDREVPRREQQELAAALRARVQWLDVGHQAPLDPRERKAFVQALLRALSTTPDGGQT